VVADFYISEFVSGLSMVARGAGEYVQIGGVVASVCFPVEGGKVDLSFCYSCPFTCGGVAIELFVF
jgi:hypothetical protein